MFTKAEIFNLALNAMLLERQIIDADQDTSVEARRLRAMYPIAFQKTVQDLDLDRFSSTKNLELIQENPNDLWNYAYKYPNDCAQIRRIVSCVRQDSRHTLIPKATASLNGVPVVFTNQYNAVLQYIPNNIGLDHFSAPAAMALAYQLANISSSLVVGKGAKEVRKEIRDLYVVYKAEAQEHDKLENFFYEEDHMVSEFVNARMS